MKDALTRACISEEQLQAFVGKRASERLNRIVIEHCEACDECWERVAKYLPKRDEKSLPLLDAMMPLQRPKTRGECKDGPRPCPWVGCRHHLWSDEHDGEPRVLGVPADEAASCSLDVADAVRDEGVAPLEPTIVGRFLQCRPERVMAIEAGAMEKLRKVEFEDAVEAAE